MLGLKLIKGAPDGRIYLLCSASADAMATWINGKRPFCRPNFSRRDQTLYVNFLYWLTHGDGPYRN